MTLLWIEPILRCPELLVRNVISYGSFWGCWGVTYLLRMTGLPQFSVVDYHHLPTAEVVVMAVLKAVVVAVVLMIAWRRRGVSGRGLFHSLGFAWLGFFALSPGVAPQYMVWLAPFVLVLSPSIGAYLMLSSSIFLFSFYHITSGGLPWHLAKSTPTTNELTSVWALCPWAFTIAAICILWRNAVRHDPDLRLMSLRPPRGEYAR
jgi:hypothetical protein